MPPIGADVKRPFKLALFIAIGIIVLGYGASFLENSFNNTDCQRYNYNDKLNGGVKEFDDKKYTINICGSGVNTSHLFGDSMDQVQLTITDEQGSLLVKRRYKIFWDGQPGHEPITIEKGKIIYQDDEKQVDHTIVMPPTFLESLRARLPFSG